MTKTLVDSNARCRMINLGTWDAARFTTDPAEAGEPRVESPATAPERPGAKAEQPKAKAEAKADPPPREDLPPPPLMTGASMVEAARGYVRQNFHVIQVDPKSKEPTNEGWAEERIEEPDVDRIFGAGDWNIGIVLGGKSGAIVDCDFDWPEAARVADVVLGMLPSFGRAGSLRSHRVARCEEALDIEGPCRHAAFNLPSIMKGDPRLTGDHPVTVCELRANGHYTLFPPSVHPSGQIVSWGDDGKLTLPAKSWSTLREQMGLVAFLAAMVRFYPPEGVRNAFSLALGGALLRPMMKAYDGEDDKLVATVDELVQVVCRSAGDKGSGPSWTRRAGKTLARIKGGSPATGMKTVCQLTALPEECSRVFATWLDPDDAVHDERPRVLYNESNLEIVFDKSENVLLENECDIFQADSRIVHVYRHGQALPGVERDPEALVIGAINESRMFQYLTEHIQFTRMVKSKDGGWIEVPLAPPRSIASDYLSRVDCWRLRDLKGIVATPTLRADGTILQTPGYDAISRLVLDTGGVKFEPVPENPTKADAQAALGRLLEVIRGFPFDGLPDGTTKTPSRSVALSMMLTAPVAKTLPAIPAHLVGAPKAGTGKSLLVDGTSIIATGCTAPTLTYTGDPAEDEKRLVGMMLQGDGMIAIDNVEERLGGSFLCQVLTQETVQVRVLGKTGEVKVPTNTMICVTGNVLKVKGDVQRRSLICSMDANCERPETRVFEGDLKQDVKVNRTKLVADVLCILRAFAISPERDQVLKGLKTADAFGGFERWTERVRGALVWLGEPDPCANRETIREDEMETEQFAALVAAWVGCPALGAGQYEADDPHWYEIDKIFEQRHGNVGLENALKALAPAGKELTANHVGRFLSQHPDDVSGEFKLRKRKNKDTRRAEYLLHPAAETAGPAQGNLGLQGKAEEARS